MRINGSCARKGSLAAAVAAVGLICPAVSAQSTHDVTVILDHVADRLADYYKRVQNIMCVEKVTTQTIDRSMTPRGFARVIESDLRVESDAVDEGAAPAEPKIVRSVRKVNGRPPGPKDKEGCFDPNPLSAEPLAFLLKAKREEYAFAWAGFGKGKDARLMMLDYRSRLTGKPELKEHERDREGCLSVSMPGGTRGRLWIDPATHDIVRIEERLIGPVDFRVPLEIQRRHYFPDIVSLDRYDVYIRYRSVAFDDPAETMLLPESIDELTLSRGASSHRSRQEFSDYKRFLTAGRIIK